MKLHFFVERRIHLASHALLIHLHWSNAEEVEKQVEFGNHVVLVKFVKESDHNKVLYAISFQLENDDATVLPSDCSISGAGATFLALHLAITFRAKVLQPVLRGASANTLFDAQALRHILCRSCRAPLVDGSAFERVLPLPSAGWLEMSELWHCKCGHSHNHTPEAHDHEHIARSESSTSSSGDVAQAQTLAEEHEHAYHGHDSRLLTAPVQRGHAQLRHEIRAQRQLCLVGKSFLLLSGTCLVADAVTRREAPAPAADNTQLLCRRCEAAVGEEEPDGDIKLTTRALTTSDGAFGMFSVETEIAADLHHFVQQNRQHRFLISHSETSSLVIMESLASEETSVVDLTERLVPHLKVLFRICRDPEDVEWCETSFAFRSLKSVGFVRLRSFLLQEKWLHQMHARKLFYTNAVCEQLCALLQDFHATVPPALQQLNGMKLAGLRLLSF